MRFQEPQMGRGDRQPIRLITVQRFSETVGYTEKAVYRKIEEGVWKEGHEYVRAPDGRVLVALDGFESWATKK